MRNLCFEEAIEPVWREIWSAKRRCDIDNFMCAVTQAQEHDARRIRRGNFSIVINITDGSGFTAKSLGWVDKPHSAAMVSTCDIVSGREQWLRRDLLS
jgi:hypothetical protein